MKPLRQSSVQAGYKQTEVGVIPEEWEVAPFGDVFSITAGGDVDPKRSQSFHDEIHCHPIYSNALTNYGLYGYCSYANHPAGSITITARGMVGGANFRDHPYTAIGRVLVLQPRSEVAGIYFAEVINHRVKFANESTGVPQLTAPQILKYRLPVPPLPEQRAIAEALSDVDALLGALDRLIAKKRDLKQAAMQQLLTGQTRLPGFHGEWEVKRLGNIATCFSGGTPPTEVAVYYGGAIPWITSGDLNKEYITEVEGRISQAGLVNSAAQMVEANTLLIALYGATSGVTAISKIRAAINQAVLAIVPRHDNTTFLYFKLRLLKDWLISTYTQGGQPNLSGDIVKSVELPLPPIPEQTAIAGVLGEMDAELAGLEQRREKTRALKQAMMQELLTGRTRLV